MVEIKCEECGKLFDVNQYQIDKGRKYCSRECLAKAKTYSEEDRKKIKKEKDLKRKMAVIKQVNDFKSEHGCKHCGITDFRVLDFHHVNPEEKKYDISKIIQKGYSWKTVKSEIDKCIVLCANCHRIVTYEEKQEAK